jgi:hypothetical protein
MLKILDHKKPAKLIKIVVAKVSHHGPNAVLAYLVFKLI